MRAWLWQRQAREDAPAESPPPRLFALVGCVIVGDCAGVRPALAAVRPPAGIACGGPLGAGVLIAWRGRA